MKPTTKLATAKTPDGGEMELYKHDRDYVIKINGQDLMSSRQHESELELARLGCAHLVGSKAPKVLIGGMGLGYTLRQSLDMLDPQAKVVVGELLGAVAEWSREFFGELNGNPLEDERVNLKTGDVVNLISRSIGKFDAILLDIDNGPSAMTHLANSRLYSYEGIMACRYALRKQGCLAVWSAEPSKKFERLLVGGCGFYLKRYRVPTYKGSKSQSHFVWVASENKANLPPGGGEPRLSRGDEPKEVRRRPRDGY